MPRIYRNSLKLYNRIDARPIRQPLFRYASDDDLVAASMGYDNVADLNKLRLVFPLIMWPDYDMDPEYRLISQEDEAKVHALLHEIEWFSGYKNKIESFVLQVSDLEAEGKLSHRAYMYAAVIFQVNLDLSRPAYSVSRRYEADKFAYDRRQQDGLKFPLPDGPAVIVPPVMEGNQEESIEDFLRVALLLESVKAIKKRSVWGRLFPGCVGSTRH